MMSILSRLASMGIFALMGLGVLAVMIWYFGPLIRFGDVAPLSSVMSRVITILLIFAIWGLVRLFKAWREKKKNSQISDELSASADAVDPAEEQSREELATLKDRFDDALKTLKKSNTGGKRIRSIYQLPWYIIIGPPGSGKTTLLVNSGLQFPLAEHGGQSKIQGIGGTRYCDWWFTDEAVMIDTAGRYTTQDSNKKADNKAWFSFLQLLKKHRRRRPINGIILAISMEELARQSSVERERNASAISARIQELYERLGIRFPVYLMFTKCDLMAGFMEFYGDLGRHERAQVWGFTYALDDDPVAKFDAEFGALQHQVEARLVQRLQDERDVNRREMIYNFPMQLGAGKQSIEEFLQRVFKPSRYTSTPMLRGIYFTSGTQEGTPFNRIMSQLARNFSLSRAATQSSPSKGKSFFINDLMSKVIFGESGLAGANLKVERLYGILRKTGLALLIATPILLNLGWWMSYSNNKQLADDIETATASVVENSKKISPSDSSLRGILPLLNETRAMPAGYAAQDDSVSIGMRVGLYQGKRLGRNGTIPAYQRLLENAFLPRLMVRMEKILKTNMTNPELIYQVLKAYLMIGDPEHMDTVFVRDWVQRDWDANLARVMSADQFTQLGEHLDALLELDPLTPPFDLDNNLVMTARDILSNTTMAERIYAVIKSENQAEGKAFSINSAAGRDGARVFIRSSNTPINQGVPAFFSPEGYNQMYLPTETRIVTEMEDESWIFATEAAGAQQLPLEELTGSIRRLYFEDYIKTWVVFLEDIRIRPFASLAQAADILRVLTSDDSPLRMLLENVSDATRLVPEQAIDDEDDGISITQRIEMYLSNPDNDSILPDPAVVDRSFAGVHSLSNAKEDRPAPLDGLLGDLQELYIYIDQLAQSSQDQLVTGLQNQAGTAISRLRLRGQRTPVPIQEWVLLVVADTNNLVAGGATAAIKAAWSTDVYPFCRQALNGRYPFSSSAQQEVQLRDFGVFFKPGGTMDTFFDRYLKDIVVTNAGTNWKLTPKVAKNIDISSSSIRQIQRASKIRDAFFAGGGASPSISFELKPVRMDPITTNFMVSINGQSTNYSHGPLLSQSFVWPGDGGTSQVYMQFSPAPASGRSGQTLDGPWGFFRLLDGSGMNPSSTPEIFRTKLALGERWIEYEIRANSAFNPFNLPDLRSFRCPEQL